jgi:hypothetical protein
MIAFNFKVLHIAFHIKPLSTFNWGTRPHKTHGKFHDVIDTRHHKHVISKPPWLEGTFFVLRMQALQFNTWLLFWGYWPDQKLVFVVGSDALTTSLRSYGPRTALRRLALFHCFKNVTIHLLVGLHRADTVQHVPFAHKSKFKYSFKSVMFTFSSISVFIMSLLQQDKESALHAHKEQLQVLIMQCVTFSSSYCSATIMCNRCQVQSCQCYHGIGDPTGSTSK